MATQVSPPNPFTDDRVSEPNPSTGDVATIRVSLPGAQGMMLSGTRKVFSTGSRGFWVGGKIQGPNGERYQVSCNLVLIGSKPQAD